MFSKFVAWIFARVIQLIGGSGQVRPHLSQQDLLKRRTINDEQSLVGMQTGHRRLVERTKGFAASQKQVPTAES